MVLLNHLLQNMYFLEAHTCIFKNFQKFLKIPASKIFTKNVKYTACSLAISIYPRFSDTSMFFNVIIVLVVITNQLCYLIWTCSLLHLLILKLIWIYFGISKFQKIWWFQKSKLENFRKWQITQKPCKHLKNWYKKSIS